MDATILIHVVAIVMPFVMIIFVTIAKSVARTQQERMRCEVMRSAIERGQPIPAEALRPPVETEDEPWHARAPSPENDIRAGLICMGVGGGLFLMFSTFSIGGFDGLQGLRWVGAIPGFVGVALLVNGWLSRSRRADTSAPGRTATDTQPGIRN